MIRMHMLKFRLLVTGAALIFTIQCEMALAKSDVSPVLDRGSFGPFVRSLNVKLHGYKLIEDQSGRAPSKYLERFEVRSGDCHFNRGFNDCKKDRERSELSEQGMRSLRGTSAWYGWNFYLDQDWPDVWPTKTVIGQFHQVRAHPVWMFLNYKGALVLDDHSQGRGTRKIELIPASELKGKWHRIEIHANWSRDKSGFFKIWVDGTPKFEMHGPTMTADAVYFKFGVYRAFISRYKATTGASEVPTQSALFANVKKSSSRSGLK